MEKKNSSQIKSFYHKIPDFLKLYLLQLTIFTIESIVSLFFNKDVITISFEQVSSNFSELITYTESPFTIFLKSFLILFINYLLIVLIGNLTNIKISKFFYILFVIASAILNITSFGGGLLTYNWGNGLFQHLINQIEWLGGSLIVCFDRKNKDSNKYFIIGAILLLVTSGLRSLIF